MMPFLLSAIGYVAILGVSIALAMQNDLGLTSLAMMALFTFALPSRISFWRARRGLFLFAAFVAVASYGTLVLVSRNPFLSTILSLVLLPTLGGLPRRWFYLGSTVVFALTTLLFAVKGTLFSFPGEFVSTLAGMLVVTFFSENFRQLRQKSEESQRLFENLLAAQEQLQDAAVGRERERLAREMHDNVGHRLTVASVGLEAAEKLFEKDPVRASEFLRTGRDQVRHALAELRQTVSALETHSSSLATKIEQTVSTFAQSTGIQIEADWGPGWQDLSEQSMECVHRVLQETLTNAYKHARPKRVRIVWNGKQLCVSNALSNANLSQAEGLGKGLLNLRQRALEVGAQLYVEPSPSTFTVRLEWGQS